MGPISARLSNLKALNLLAGDGWPWSVFIDDLRVISEILDSPSEFLLYLKGRIRLNDHGKVLSFSELDYLGHFLMEGLEFNHEYYESYSAIFTDGFTVPLDRYYEYLAGRLPEAPKPHLNAPDGLLRLVSDLERTGRLGLTEVTTTLLRLGRGTHEEILEGLKFVKRLGAGDGKDHDRTMTFPQLDLGLTFIVRRQVPPKPLDELRSTFQKAMMREGVGTWMLIAVDVQPDEDEIHDFRILLSSPNRAIMTVGRNEPCPCGSGKKYKKCCGKATS